MTSHMLVSFSDVFDGAGIIAGGPFNCFEGDYATGKKRCGFTATEPIDVDQLISNAEGYEYEGKIDSLSNLNGKPIYIFQG